MTTQLLPGEGFELIGDSDDCFEDPVRKSRICGCPPPAPPSFVCVRACSCELRCGCCVLPC